MRLVDQVKQAVAAIGAQNLHVALIGGLALAAHRVVRGTRDVDFLADADDGDRLHEILLHLGYHCVHRSANAANYLRGDEGLDLLYAHRPEARRLRDLDDIRSLLRANRASLDMNEVRRYFAIFNREPLLDELLAEPDR